MPLVHCDEYKACIKTFIPGTPDGHGGHGPPKPVIRCTSWCRMAKPGDPVRPGWTRVEREVPDGTKPGDVIITVEEKDNANMDTEKKKRCLTPDELLRRLSGMRMVARSFNAKCNTNLSPQSSAAIYGGPRDVISPPLGTAAFDLNGLANNAESAAVTPAQPTGIERAYKLTLVQPNSIGYTGWYLRVYVGGNLRLNIAAEMLNPANGNDCISVACKSPLCVGALESLTWTIVNTSGAAFGVGANVRTQWALILPGDSDWPQCWPEECDPGCGPTQACGECHETPCACGGG